MSDRHQRFHGAAEAKETFEQDSKPAGAAKDADKCEPKQQPTVCDLFAKQEVAQAKQGSDSENKALLWKAVDFVSKTLLIQLEPFFNQYVPVFDPFSEEHKLEYTEAYAEYERLFDLHLQEFAEKEGFKTPAQFYEHISVSSSDGDKAVQKMVKLFIARSDYPKFVSMMKRRRSIISATEEM